MRRPSGGSRVRILTEDVAIFVIKIEKAKKTKIGPVLAKILEKISEHDIEEMLAYY